MPRRPVIPSNGRTRARAIARHLFDGRGAYRRCRDGILRKVCRSRTKKKKKKKNKKKIKTQKKKKKKKKKKKVDCRRSLGRNGPWPHVSNIPTLIRNRVFFSDPEPGLVPSGRPMATPGDLFPPTGFQPPMAVFSTNSGPFAEGRVDRARERKRGSRKGEMGPEVFTEGAYPAPWGFATNGLMRHTRTRGGRTTRSQSVSTLPFTDPKERISCSSPGDTSVLGAPHPNQGLQRPSSRRHTPDALWSVGGKGSISRHSRRQPCGLPPASPSGLTLGVFDGRLLSFVLRFLRLRSPSQGLRAPSREGPGSGCAEGEIPTGFSIWAMRRQPRFCRRKFDGDARPAAERFGLSGPAIVNCLAAKQHYYPAPTPSRGSC